MSPTEQRQGETEDDKALDCKLADEEAKKKASNLRVFGCNVISFVMLQADPVPESPASSFSTSTARSSDGAMTQ